jgi:hypothetical protein
MRTPSAELLCRRSQLRQQMEALETDRRLSPKRKARMIASAQDQVRKIGCALKVRGRSQ